MTTLPRSMYLRNCAYCFLLLVTNIIESSYQRLQEYRRDGQAAVPRARGGPKKTAMTVLFPHKLT
jgi:hypothetical protein